AGTKAYLAIGVPRESIGSIQAAGAVHVLYTDSTGRLTSTGSKFYTQDTPGIQDKVEANDFFGDSLATGNFDAKGSDDLAIGIPFEDLSVVDAGAVQILYDADTTSTRWFHEGAEQQTEDFFGWRLAQ